MARADGKPSIFISYSHDSAEHRQRVLALADRLGGDGFHCILDQYEVAPPEGWPRWMDRHLRTADFVILVCSATYYRRVIGEEQPGKGHGVAWEGQLVYQYLYAAGSLNTRFVPVLLEGASPAQIPEPLQGASYFQPELEAQYRALLRRLRLQADAQRPSATAPEKSVWLVPKARNPFFGGRDGILALLQERFAGAEGTDIQALCGLGGVGKSQLALEYAYRHRDEYAAVFWLCADSVDSLAFAYGQLADTLRLAVRSADQAGGIDAVLRWLEANERWLLILDNVESAESIARFLPRQRKGHVLVTSRLRLLDAAGAKRPILVNQLEEEDALAFLLARAGREHPAEAERSAARDLTRELGCLPLALEQAGAYILALEARFDDYLQEYRKERLRVLESKAPVQGEYLHSVATTWRVNFREVKRKKASAELLQLSSLLNADVIPLDLFTRAAAELGPALASALRDPDGLAVNEVLEPLSRYSLIRRDLASRSFSMHRLVQDVLRDEMTPKQREQRATRLLRGLARAFPSPEELFARWRNCDAYVPHVQACAEFAQLAPQAGADLLTNAGFYAARRGQYALAEALLERAIRIAEALGDAERPRLAHAIDRLGWVQFKRGQMALAEASYSRALQLREAALGARHVELTHSWSHLATLYDEQRRWSESEALHLQILALLEELAPGDDRRIGIALVNLALLYGNQGRLDEAIDCCRRGLSMLEHSMDEALLAQSVENMGWLHYRLKQYEEADAMFRRALEMHERSLGAEHPDVARSLTNLAILGLEVGALDVEGLFRRALEIRRSSLPADHPDLAASLANLGEFCASLNRDAEAEALYRDALATVERAFGSTHPAVARTLDRIIALLRKLGREAEAAPLEQRAQCIRALAGGHAVNAA